MEECYLAAKVFGYAIAGAAGLMLVSLVAMLAIGHILRDVDMSGEDESN